MPPLSYPAAGAFLVNGPTAYHDIQNIDEINGKYLVINLKKPGCILKKV